MDARSWFYPDPVTLKELRRAGRGHSAGAGASGRLRRRLRCRGVLRA